MELKLYKTTDDDNVINKDLEFIKSININLKDNVNVTNPDLKLRMNVDDVKNFNYAEIDLLNRKYFVRDIQNLNNDVWLVRLECDVLETYKDDILNSKANVTRNIRVGDYQDISQEFEVKRDVHIYESNRTLNREKTMILSTISGV